LVRVTIGDGIEGWRRQRAVWSGETAELDYGEGVLGEGFVQARFAPVGVPQGEVGGAFAKGRALVEALPGAKILRDKRIVVVAGQQMVVVHNRLLWGQK